MWFSRIAIRIFPDGNTNDWWFLFIGLKIHRKVITNLW